MRIGGEHHLLCYQRIPAGQRHVVGLIDLHHAQYGRLKVNEAVRHKRGQ